MVVVSVTGIIIAFYCGYISDGWSYRGGSCVIVVCGGRAGCSRRLWWICRWGLRGYALL